MKKYTSVFRSLIAATLITIVLSLIGIANVFGMSSPKGSTILTYFATSFLGCWGASKIVKAMNTEAANKNANKSL